MQKAELRVATEAVFSLSALVDLALQEKVLDWQVSYTCARGKYICEDFSSSFLKVDLQEDIHHSMTRRPVMAPCLG